VKSLFSESVYIKHIMYISELLPNNAVHWNSTVRYQKVGVASNQQFMFLAFGGRLPDNVYS
jgi:hypothetical protein